MITEAFLKVKTFGPHVMEGNYDLIGPSGEIILPAFWERAIVPGMRIRMTMWPIPEGENKFSSTATAAAKVCERFF